MSPGCLFLPFLFLPSLKKQRQEKLLAEFRKFLSIFHSYLAAGYSAENAAELSYPELLSVTGENSYMASELRRFLQGLQQKRSLEDSLRQFAYRSGLEDIENFAEIFAIARHSGGDFLKIVRQSIEVIHDKSSILEEIKTNLSAKRYEQKLMNLIPIFLIWYLSFSSPDFFLPLFHTLPGRILMSFCLLLYLLSFKLSEKILSIEV